VARYYYEQWLPCEVVAEADQRDVVAVVAGIVRHIAAHFEDDGLTSSRLRWTCDVISEPYANYAIRATLI